MDREWTRSLGPTRQAQPLRLTVERPEPSTDGRNHALWRFGARRLTLRGLLLTAERQCRSENCDPSRNRPELKRPVHTAQDS